jgi:putative IMPACT (imprinted ancient) family translation regulator
VFFNTYNPIEIDSTVSLEEKKKAMEKRREKQFNLMLEYGLTRDIIKNAMQSDDDIFRS